MRCLADDGHSSRKWSLENYLRIKSMFPKETLVLLALNRPLKLIAMFSLCDFYLNEDIS